MKTIHSNSVVSNALSVRNSKQGIATNAKDSKGREIKVGDKIDIFFGMSGWKDGGVVTKVGEYNQVWYKDVFGHIVGTQGNATTVKNSVAHNSLVAGLDDIAVAKSRIESGPYSKGHYVDAIEYNLSHGYPYTPKFHEDDIRGLEKSVDSFRKESEYFLKKAQQEPANKDTYMKAAQISKRWSEEARKMLPKAKAWATATNAVAKNSIDFMNIRKILSKYNYKTNFGNLIEYTEGSLSNENRLIVESYKESQGWGGGGYLPISATLAPRIVNDLQKHYKIDSWKLDNGKLVMTGEFKEPITNSVARNSKFKKGDKVRLTTASSSANLNKTYTVIDPEHGYFKNKPGMVLEDHWGMTTMTTEDKVRLATKDEIMSNSVVRNALGVSANSKFKVGDRVLLKQGGADWGTITRVGGKMHGEQLYNIRWDNSGDDIQLEYELVGSQKDVR